MKNVAISIVTYKALDRAKACVEAVLKNSGEARLILTANANEEAHQFFLSVADANPNRVTVIWHKENKGFGRAHNIAFSLVPTTPFFLCLNDDTIPPPGWLNTLMAPFDKDPMAALSCPSNTCSQLLPTFHGRPGAREYCEGSCLLIRSEVARKHGLFDETLPGLAYGEDSDLSLRYRQLGYTLHWVPVDVKHAGASTSRQMPEVKAWQEANHAVLRIRWHEYLRRRTFGYPIVLKRTGAMGDCLLMTPVIAALCEQRPLSSIYVETACPEIFANNPNVVRAASKIKAQPNELRIMLDGTYEAEPEKSFVETYATKAGVALGSSRTSLYCTPADRAFADAKIQGDGWVAIHAGPVNWENKQWSLTRWAEVATALKAEGRRVVLVGSESRDKTIPCDLDLRGKTSIQQLAGCLANCELAVTLDSFPMHAAQAVGTPIVALFGVTLPGPILTDGSPWIAVQSDANHPGTGLRHRVKNKVFTPTRNNPMETITVSQVLNAIQLMFTQLATPPTPPMEAFD